MHSLQEQDNLTRWNESLKVDDKKGFFEIYYLKFNDLQKNIAGWLRYTLLISLDRPPEASVWAIFFDALNPKNNCAVKKTYPLSETQIEKEIFYFGVGPSAIFSQGARGDVKDGDFHFKWELKFSVAEEDRVALRHYPFPFYHTGFPKTKFLAPYLKTHISGEFSINNQTYFLDQIPAHQAHLWGREMIHSWVWGNCNTFIEDPHFCFEGLSSQLKIGSPGENGTQEKEILSPPLTLLYFYWEGKMYSFNSPVRWLKNTSRKSLDRWVFGGGDQKIRFAGRFYARTEDMVGVRYENPDGSSRYCHNTKTADLVIDILKNTKSGWKNIQTLHAEKSAAFELVQPTQDDRVRLMIP